MKFQSSKLIRLASMGASGLALVSSIQAATTLTGSGLANNTTIPSNHGSNDVGTPDISLNWSPTGGGGWQAYTAWPNGGTGGHVYQLDGPGSGYTGATAYQIVFTPGSATIAVILTSIGLNDWGGPDDPLLQNTILDWSVTGSVSGLLGSGSGVVVNDGTASTLNFGIQGQGGEALTLALRPTGGSGSYFAVDNLSFD